MKRALVISLNFNPGHVSHMVASYLQMEELGYECVFCVDGSFISYLPKNSRFCVYGKDAVPNVDVSLFLFPSQKNLLLIRKLKRHGSKILYIFHEPLAPMNEYRKAGFSYKYLVKLWVINRISRLTIKWSDAVLLPSKKAVDLYKANASYRNPNFHYLPLLYSDERTDELSQMERRYFGYIGTVAADHSFEEYLEFVKWAISEKRLPQLSFLIATKSEFVVPKLLEDSSRVTILKGKPMSDEEINKCYASSFAIWNAYVRTTQSGVLAKSFMFGTPAIVLKKNLSEFAEDGLEVVAIEDNTSFYDVETAILRITSSFPHFSKAARKRFEDTFFYVRYNNTFKNILSSL